MNLTTPFRYDYVGSFLRPEELKQARADHEAGHIDDAALKAMEDAAITELIAKQKAAGVSRALVIRRRSVGCSFKERRRRLTTRF